MFRNIKILSSLLALLLLLGQCKETYISPYKSPTTGYLVVEGYIAKGPTRLTLSRVIALPGDSALPAVRGASVQVEGSDNSVYPLAETGIGVYSADTLPLNPTAKYRLRITTGSDTYLSDLVEYKTTPPIDSINWIRDPSGVNIYVNTHDPAGNTRYYQWDYQETWQYTSAEFSAYRFKAQSAHDGSDSVVARADSEYVYNCYRNRASTVLFLGTSTKLAQDEIYRQPLTFISSARQELSVLYSINVKQYALTKEAYEFLSLMKANTESLGSIFDAQPSELRGNIHSLTHPEEPVVGYISAGSIQQQRMFISQTQVPGWGYFFACDHPDHLVVPDSLDFYFKADMFTPLARQYGQFGFIGWTGNYMLCVDCTVQGGTTKKPSFWPY